MGLEASLRTVLMVIPVIAATPSAAQSPAPPVGSQESGSAAPSLVTRAIARRRATLSALSGFGYQAFVKLDGRDLRAPSESARCVVLLTEVRSSVFWELPDRYQETIEARRRTNEGGIGRAPATVEEIAHFERRYVTLQEGGDVSRIRSVGTRSSLASARSARAGQESGQYSLLLPVAPGALKWYDYAIAETLSVEGQRVIRLAVRPRTDAVPLFTGTVDVLDSSYDVVAMDLGVNDAVRFPTVSHLRYRQRLRDVGAGWWLPYEIRLSGDMRRAISASWLPRTVVGMALPEFPRQVAFEEVAALSAFNFDPLRRPVDLVEYRAVLRDDADDADTATWSAPEAVPLTEAERAAWAEGDSAERHPSFVPRMARDADAVGQMAFGPGAYHFNRVDGLYLGAVHTWPMAPGVTFATKLGYALGREGWQYRAGARVMLSAVRQLWMGATYHDETVAWRALVSGGYDPANAFLNGIDPNDYYRDRGLALSLGAKLVDFTRFELRFDDSRQTSLDTLPGLGFRSRSQPQLPNPPIQDGRLRSLSGTLTLDSRQLARYRGVDARLSGENWTRLSLGAEIAAHAILASDFSFRRYTFQFERQQHVGRVGSATLTVTGGLATHFAPPQQYFTVGYGRQFLAAEGAGFNTLSRVEFAGNRALMLSLRHDFGHLFFAGSGLPLLKRIPATISFHGGAFWTSLVGNVPAPADSLLTLARRPYTEAGFTIGNLTPFLAPFDFAASLTWQLSSYPTQGFRFGFGFSGP